jgi:prepilin signal peptidase PulO-like enzyme (type II secretory pathway)
MQFRFLIGYSFLASLLRQFSSVNCDSSEFFPYSMMENLAMVAISFTSPAIQDALGLDFVLMQKILWSIHQKDRL